MEHTLNRVAHVVEPERQTPLHGSYDVVVLGAGPAGLAAAVSARRAGAQTLLLERYGFMGGMGTAAGVTNFCGLYANHFGSHLQVVHGVADELLAGITALDGLKAPHLILGRVMAQAYDTAAYKIAADRLVAQARVDLLLHALGAGVTMSSARRIDTLLIETKSGRRAVRGTVFIDASGDGDLAAWAGAPYEVGDGAGSMLYPSTMFRINAVDPAAVAARAWEQIPRLMEEEERITGRRFPRQGAIVRPQPHELEWRANLTQIRTPEGQAASGIDADQLSQAEVEGRRQARDTFLFLKERVPGFEHSYIVDIAPQVGIRETRRVIGEYQLSEQDVLECAGFPDSIGVNAWPVEEHVSGQVLFRWQYIPHCRGFNQLPYRMLLPPAIDNLLVVGRCASMTHGGQSAARVSGACFAMGQAAGSAAALAVQGNIPPRLIDVSYLQQHLEQAGVFLG